MFAYLIINQHLEDGETSLVISRPVLRVHKQVFISTSPAANLRSIQTPSTATVSGIETQTYRNCELLAGCFTAA